LEVFALFRGVGLAVLHYALQGTIRQRKKRDAPEALMNLNAWVLCHCSVANEY
jgi:hypothetical protein